MDSAVPSAENTRSNGVAKALDPLNCSATELATFLLKRRFEDDAMGTASFLLECTASLPNAEEISAQIMGGGAPVVEAEAVEEGESSDGDGDDDAEDALGAVVPLPRLSGGGEEGDGDAGRPSAEVSATVPRSKFELTARERGIVLTNKKGERLSIGSESVTNVAMFPKPEDCRAPSAGAGRKKGGASPKRNGSMVLITLRELDEKGGAGVSFRSKPLKQVCFQLPQYNASSPDGLDNDVEGEWAKLLQSSLRPEGKVIRVANPAFGKGEGKRGAKNPDGSPIFRSDEGDVGTSVTTGGMPFVKCYQGVNDGVVYPLEQGLLFFKPPLFIHRSKLHSISCGRGSSSSGSRYVDLVAVLHGSDSDDDDGDGGETMEFSNINREELRVLNNYIHKVLVRAMAKDAADGSDDDDDEMVVEEVVAVNNDQDEEDGKGDDAPGRRKRSRRAASREARAATKAQIAALEARKAAKAPQSGEDEQEDDSDDDDEEDAEEFRIDDHDSDSDEDGLANDVGVAMVDESDDEDAQIEEDEDEESASDEDETESESESDEKGDNEPRQKKKAKND